IHPEIVGVGVAQPRTSLRGGDPAGEASACLPTIEPMFVHLRLHTEFSIVDGTNRIDDVVKAAAANGQPALGITDLNNLFGAIKFHKEARSAGVKPIVRTEILVAGLVTDPAML